MANPFLTADGRLDWDKIKAAHHCRMDEIAEWAIRDPKACRAWNLKRLSGFTKCAREYLKVVKEHGVSEEEYDYT